MAYSPFEPYDDLPLLPPGIDVETKAVLKRAMSASRALAELKGSDGLIPDQAILINAIPLQEAKASSEIENIVTTNDALYRAADITSAATDPQTKEVLRYRTALYRGYEKVKAGGISLDLIRDLCSMLRDADVDFRTDGQNVFIGNRVSRKKSYTPPQGGPILLTKLRNLEDYLNRSDGPDPIIKMAAAHYQFEAIHPFDDGNGRTGRILNILYLVRAGLLDIPVLYLSGFIIKNKPEYYRRLRGVTEANEWEAWLVYMLEGVEQTALWTRSRIEGIRTLLDSTIERCRGELPKIYSKELIELIFRRPYCRIADLVDSGIAKRQTASEYLQELERLGILSGEKAGRELIYRNEALLKVLTS